MPPIRGAQSPRGAIHIGGNDFIQNLPAAASSESPRLRFCFYDVLHTVFHRGLSRCIGGLRSRKFSRRLAFSLSLFVDGPRCVEAFFFSSGSRVDGVCDDEEKGGTAFVWEHGGTRGLWDARGDVCKRVPR